MNATDRYKKQRGKIHGTCAKHGVQAYNVGLLVDDLMALFVEMAADMNAELDAPYSEHVKALKEAGIYPTDQVMVKYVDLRAKRGGFDVDALFTAAVEWKARGFNPKNLAGICDWAEFGIESARSYPQVKA